jgi:hypothetical protein
MKNIIIGILLVASVGLGGLLIQNNNSAATQAAELARAKDELAALRASLAQSEENTARISAKLEAVNQQAFTSAAAASRLSRALTNQALAKNDGDATNSKPVNPLADMFKNPEMRDMIKKQQRTMMSAMVDKNYAEFFKSMNLTPEQTETMKGLILDKMLSGAEMSMEMMGGEMDADKRAELSKRMKEANETTKSKLKELLGEENYADFETYEKSMPDRNAVSQFKGQLGDALRINDEQERALIAAMGEERQGFKFTTDFNNKEDFSEDMMSRFTEERVDLFFQEQKQLNERYLARAESVLTPEQFTAYKKSLTNQEEMMKMGMKMAASMFGKKK